MELYDRLYKMNTVFGIWQYTKRFRITYVAQGWLIVWDHRQSPPTRYDCHKSNHSEACLAVMDTVSELMGSS